MARSAVEVIRGQLEEAYEGLRERVLGLTDDEFFWEPVPRCWTVRRRGDGQWAVDYPEPPHPDPAPFTTIGWRLVHVAECKIMYQEYAFGPAKLTFPDIDSAHTAAAAIAQLEAGHELLIRDLATLDDADLERDVMTNWGENWPARRIFWTIGQPRSASRRGNRSASGPLSRARALEHPLIARLADGDHRVHA